MKASRPSAADAGAGSVDPNQQLSAVTGEPNAGGRGFQRALSLIDCALETPTQLGFSPGRCKARSCSVDGLTAPTFETNPPRCSRYLTDVSTALQLAIQTFGSDFRAFCARSLSPHRVWTSGEGRAEAPQNGHPEATVSSCKSITPWSGGGQQGQPSSRLPQAADSMQHLLTGSRSGTSRATLAHRGPSIAHSHELTNHAGACAFSRSRRTYASPSIRSFAQGAPGQARMESPPFIAGTASLVEPS